MRRYAKLQSFNQKDVARLEDWVRRHFMRFNRSAKVCTWGGKIPYAGKGRPSSSPAKKQQALTMGARLQRNQVCSHCNMGNPILRYTGRGWGKPTIPRDLVLLKFHRLSKNCNLDISPQTYPLLTHSL